MENINFDESLRELPRVVCSDNKNSSGDLFGRYAAMYIAPTFNVIDSVNLLDSQRINRALVVGTGGAYIFELLLKGVKNIDAFDINVYQYYYHELIKAGIKTFNYEDFLRFFCADKHGSGQDLSYMFNGLLMNDLLWIMDGNARNFWSILLTLSNFNPTALLDTELFRTTYILYPEYLKKYSSIYNRDTYYKLQKILLSNDYNVDYRIMSIEEIPNEFSGNSYDAMCFGNIFQYYKSIPFLNNVYRVHHFINDDIAPMLNDGGVVQVDYGFEIASDALSKVLKRKKNNLSFNDQLLSEVTKKTINKEIKDGIITGLVKRFGYDYSWDFIPGVETDPEIDHTSENVVLSYVKKINI